MIRLRVQEGRIAQPNRCSGSAPTPADLVSTRKLHFDSISSLQFCAVHVMVHGIDGYTFRYTLNSAIAEAYGRDDSRRVDSDLTMLWCICYYYTSSAHIMLFKTELAGHRRHTSDPSASDGRLRYRLRDCGIVMQNIHGNSHFVAPIFEFCRHS